MTDISEMFWDIQPLELLVKIVLIPHSNYLGFHGNILILHTLKNITPLANFYVRDHSSQRVENQSMNVKTKPCNISWHPSKTREKMRLIVILFATVRSPGGPGWLDRCEGLHLCVHD